MRSTSPSRRAAGLMAATTIGLSTALLSAVGVASAEETTVVTDSSTTTAAAPSGEPSTTPVESTAPVQSSTSVTESSAPVGASVTTETVVPEIAAATAPGALALTQVLSGDAQVLVQFTPGTTGDTPPVTYEYQLDGGAWTALTLGQPFGGDLTASIEGLTNLREYSLSLRAVSAGGSGPATEPVTVMTFIPMSPPSTVTAVVGVTSVKISWTPAADAAGVAGYQAFALSEGANDNDGLTLCETDAAGRSCVVQVPAGQAYGFGVSAFDVQENLGEPAFGADVTAVVPASATPTTLPTTSAPLTSTDTDGVVAPGASITLTGDGYLPGSNIELIMYSTPVSLGTVVADVHGRFSATVTLPAGVAPGSKHHLVSAGVDANGNPRYLVTEITVAGGSTAGGLAYTGFSPMPFVGAGVLTLVAGGGLLLAARRRAQ